MISYFSFKLLKNNSFRTICCLIGILSISLGTLTYGQAADSPLKNLHQSHPRLLLLSGEEQDILKSFNRNPDWKNLHLAILAECDQLNDVSPVERIKIGRRLLDKSREALRRIFQLSYAYRTTGEVKYLQRAEKEMLAIAAFEDWNPTHFLDVAEMTMAMAIGYDWLFDQLSDDSKMKIRTAIIEKGINPSFDDKYNGFLKAHHNWNQVCNAGMTFGALAIAENEPELAASVISRAVKSIPLAMKTSYEPDGAYPEGFSYWGYGTSFNVLFNSAVEKALGTDFGLSAAPGFLKTAGFMENIVGTTGMAHNWGDSGLNEGLSPAMFWFAEKTNDASLLWSQKEYLKKIEKNAVKNRLLPAALIWGAKINTKAIKAPKSLLWYGQGPNPVAFMRSSWTDKNAIFVGFKTGSPSVNHAHMDVGSFVIDALGERWAMDFGSQNYNSLETAGVDLWNRSQKSQRWEVFRLNNMAHNTLTFGNQLQDVKGYAQIDAVSAKAEKLFAVSDLTELYKGEILSAKRGISILNKTAVLIQDEIKANANATTLRWNWLTGADVKIIDDKTVELSKNGKKMRLKLEVSSDFKIKEWSTKPTHSYDAENPGTQFVGIEVALPANESVTIKALLSENSAQIPATKLSDWK